MKFASRVWLLGVVPLLASCATQPITLAPVGPPPTAAAGNPGPGKGQLQVFTQTDETEYDQDVPFYPHRDYEIYSVNGKRFRHVWNHQDREDERPTVVTLPAGQYLVKADAELYGMVAIPVVIKANQLTRVILQPGWNPGKEIAETDLVHLPNGYPVGWRAELPADR